MIDDRFEELLEGAAREYNPPPETPREVIWARIEAARRERARERERVRRLYSPWIRWGIGIAAALAVGIGIGRLTLRESVDSAPLAGGGTVETTSPGTSAAGGEEGLAVRQLAYRLVATEHLGRAETFLTSFRSGTPAEATDADFWSGAGELLASTRLLLDSPAAGDPLFRSLLEDLELVLVQIVRLASERGDRELALIKEGLEHKALLPRLRTAIPAGSLVGVEGVL